MSNDTKSLGDVLSAYEYDFICQSFAETHLIYSAESSCYYKGSDIKDTKKEIYKTIEALENRIKSLKGICKKLEEE